MVENSARRIVKNQQLMYEKEIQLNKIKICMYSVQINPHFLYNSLGYVSDCAMQNKTEQIIQMIDMLTYIFRYSLSDSVETTIEGEMDIGIKFLKIFELRYPGRVTYSIEIDDDVAETPVIKMLIQSLVENACKHGVMKSTGTRHIILKAYREGDFIKLVVMDNGGTITAQQCEEINRKLNNHISDDVEITKHIGLANISNRIKLCYGEKSGFEISVNSENYTQATIKIYVGDN